MSRSTWTEEKITRLFKEGRGEGHGASYKPFIEITDLSSLGTSHRVPSRKTGRVHHLLSNIEYEFFLMLEWNQDIVDIREQFPLPRELTLAVASENRLCHPTYPGTKIPTVMTIDTLVTRLLDGEETIECYDIKPANEAENFRSIEKLEITRIACEELEYPHRLIFDTMLPKTKIKNLKWIRSAQIQEGEDDIKDLLADHTARLFHFLAREPKEKTLRQCCDTYDSTIGLRSGSALRFARVLMFERALAPNLNRDDITSSPLSEFQFFAQAGLLRAVGE